MTIAKSVEAMNQHNIGALPVLDDQHQVIGMLSERDVLKKIVAHKLNYDTTLVKDVMSKNPITITPDTPIIEALKIMSDKRFRHLPVVENNKMIHIISSGDINKWLLDTQDTIIKQLETYITG